MGRIAKVLRIILAVYCGIVVFGLFMVLVTSAFSESPDWGKFLIILAFVLTIIILIYDVICLIKDENIILEAIQSGNIGDFFENLGSIIAAPFIALGNGIEALSDKIHSSSRQRKAKASRTPKSKAQKVKQPKVAKEKVKYTKTKRYDPFKVRMEYHKYEDLPKLEGNFKGFPKRYTFKHNKNVQPYANNPLELAWFKGEDMFEINHAKNERKKQKEQEKIKRKVEALERYGKRHNYRGHYTATREIYYDRGWMKRPEHLERMFKELAAKEREERRREREELDRKYKERAKRIAEEAGKFESTDGSPNYYEIENKVSSIYCSSGNLYGEITSVDCIGSNGEYKIYFSCRVSADYGGLDNTVSRSNAQYVANCLTDQILSSVRCMRGVRRVSVQCTGVDY